MTVEIAVLIAQALIKYGPGLASQLSAIFQKADPTFADFDALFAQVKTYEEYVAPK